MDASSNRVFPCSRNCTSAAEAGCSYPDCVDAIPNRICDKPHTGDPDSCEDCGYPGAPHATRNREAEYDIGYRDGESSGYADWIGMLLNQGISVQGPREFEQMMNEKGKWPK